MSPDINDTSDLPAPFAEAWCERTPLRVWNISGFTEVIVKAPDPRGAAALAAYLAGYMGGLDLDNAGRDHLGAFSLYCGEGRRFFVRPLDQHPAVAA